MPNSDEETKRAAARTNEARHRFFLEQTMEGFYRLDFDPPIPADLGEDEMVGKMYECGYIGECNAVYAKTYGYDTPEEMIGVRLVEIHGGPDVPGENLEAMREFVRAGLRHIGIETVEVGAEGEPVWLLNNSVGIVEDGLYTCCWGTQRDITEQKKAEELVRESREQLRALAAGLRRAQGVERAHCARLIHDELGQLLTGLKLDIRWLENRLSDPGIPPELNPLLDRTVAASELIDQTIAAVQRIATEIRPGTLDQLTLGEALAAKARRFEERSDIPVHLDLSEPQPEISPETANELFYICQEALTNVARHSRAGHVEIRLHQEGREILLEIRDDGVGIDSTKHPSRSSLGLLGMEERAIQCGGTIEVAACDPSGTRIMVRVPNETRDPPGSETKLKPELADAGVAG